jgi:hypothetical protein
MSDEVELYGDEVFMKKSDVLRSIDLLAQLSQVYEDLLRKHFQGMDSMSADELIMEHGDAMSELQYMTIDSFIKFWNNIEELESRYEQ